MRFPLCLIALMMVASGCDEATPAETDAGEPGACDEPDRSCPASRPFEGAPCDYADACPYVVAEGEEWSYTCVDGTWVGAVECMIIGGGCVPPLAELCSFPDRDGPAGTVEVGPVVPGPFVPFTDGEMAPTEVGGQGSWMLPYRIRLPESAPACVEVITTLRSPISEDLVERLSVRARCGRTLGIFTIIPNGDPCDVTMPVEVELTVGRHGRRLDDGHGDDPRRGVLPRPARLKRLARLRVVRIWRPDGENLTWRKNRAPGATGS